jgi:hypothetical protein
LGAIFFVGSVTWVGGMAIYVNLYGDLRNFMPGEIFQKKGRDQASVRLRRRDEVIFCVE